MRDLSVSDMHYLFEIFISLPDFDETNFIHIQESSLVVDEPITEEPSEKKQNVSESQVNL